jgi:2'-5' RNA ligase
VTRTALIVEVPEAEPLVSDWRARHDWSAQHGVPAHLTILFPFVPVTEFDVVAPQLAELFAAEPRFHFELTHVGRFPDVAWLAPAPAEPFSCLTALVETNFPEYPPYEGIHEVVIPHLTVAEGGAELQDEVEAALRPHLPIAARADEVTLIVEDESGRWRTGERFPLGGRGKRQR